MVSMNNDTEKMDNGTEKRGSDPEKRGSNPSEKRDSNPSEKRGSNPEKDQPPPPKKAKMSKMMERFPTFDLALLVLVIVFIIVDIILAVCIKLILPLYITQKGYYPASGTGYEFEEAVLTCPCLHRVFQHGSRHLITFEKISHKALYKRSVKAVETSNTKKYPYLVSLSIPAYRDDTTEKLFACNGLVLTDDWLLTSKNCVQEDSEWYELTVRSESTFWSVHGKEHTVVDFVKEDHGLVRVKVFPKFSDKVVPYNPPIKYPYDGNWTYAISLGWDDQMYKKRLPFRHKFKMFDVEEWTSKTSDSSSTKVCYDSFKCGKTSSKHLLTSCRQLIGEKSLDEDYCSTFSRSTLPDGKNKKCYPIYEDTHVSKEVEICRV